MAETLWNDFASNQEAGRGAVLSKRLYRDLYIKMGEDIAIAKDTLIFWKQNKRANEHQKLVFQAIESFWENTNKKWYTLSNERFISNQDNAVLAYDVSILNSVCRTPDILKKIFDILKERPTTFGIGADYDDIEHALDNLLERVKNPRNIPEPINRILEKQPNFLILPTYSFIPIPKMNDWTIFPVIPVGLVRETRIADESKPEEEMIGEQFPIQYGFFIHDLGHAIPLITSFGSQQPMSIRTLRKKVAQRLAIRADFLSLNAKPYETRSRRMYEFIWFRASHEFGYRLAREIRIHSSDFSILSLATALPPEIFWYDEYFLNRRPSEDEMREVTLKLIQAQGHNLAF